MSKNFVAALVAAFISLFALTAKAQGDIEGTAGVCESQYASCSGDKKKSAQALAACTQYVDTYCATNDSFTTVAVGQIPKPKAPPPPPTPPPAPKPPAPPPPLPPPPPPAKEWTCKGFGHTPEKAKTAEGCTCKDSGGKPSATHAPVHDLTDHTVWCVVSSQLPEFKQAADWIAELNDPVLFPPSTIKDREAKLKRVKDLLLKIEMMKQDGESAADGSSADALTALRGQISGLEERLDGWLKGQCDIENPRDPKWTPGAVRLQCDAHVKELARGEAIKLVPRAHVTAAVAFAGGPTGQQVAGELSVLHEFGTYRRARLVSGLTVGGTFNAPKTGGQMYVWPQIGSRVYLGDPFSRNTFSLDLLVGGKQHVSAYGHNPTFEGIRYNDSQFWGTFATVACNVNIVVSSWLHVGFGGWVGYGWKVNTYPNAPRPSKTLAAQDGVGGGGRLFASFDF